MVSDMPEFDNIYWPHGVEYWNIDGMGRILVDMSGDSEQRKADNTSIGAISAGGFNDNDSYCESDGSSSVEDEDTVVSDISAKDSRQLLYAHVYNYLIKNEHYETARQFSREADLPLSRNNAKGMKTAEVDKSSAINNKQQKNQQHPPDLLQTRLKVDSEETLLLEWWNCFCKLHDHVDQTPLDELSTAQLDIPTAFLPDSRERTSAARSSNPVEEPDSI